MTIEDVVNKVGLPVFVSLIYFGVEEDIIIEYRADGNYGTSGWVSKDGNKYSTTLIYRLSGVTFYQALSDDLQVETNECKCPTLINGHHQDCVYKETK